MGEKPTDEEADKMIKETDVDDVQQRPPGMSQGDSAGAGFRMNCGRNRGSYADQNTGARAESYGEADRSSCFTAFHWSESHLNRSSTCKNHR